MKNEQKWLVFEDEDKDGWQIVLPNFDIRAHSNDSDEVIKAYSGRELEIKAELAGEDCPCRPRIDEENKMIIHNSFIDQQRIRKSIKKTFPHIPLSI